MESITNAIGSRSIVLLILQVMRKMVQSRKKAMQSTINVIIDHVVWTPSHLILMPTEAIEGVNL